MIKEISLLDEAKRVRELLMSPGRKSPEEALVAFRRFMADHHGVTELSGEAWERYLAVYRGDVVMASLLSYMGLL